jgi:hypothetical protein
VSSAAPEVLGGVSNPREIIVFWIAEVFLLPFYGCVIYAVQGSQFRVRGVGWSGEGVLGGLALVFEALQIFYDLLAGVEVELRLSLLLSLVPSLTLIQMLV